METSNNKKCAKPWCMHTLPLSNSRKHCKKCRKHDTDNKRAERARTKAQANNSKETGQKRVRENEADTEERLATRPRTGASKNASRKESDTETDDDEDGIFVELDEKVGQQIILLFIKVNSQGYRK